MVSLIPRFESWLDLESMGLDLLDVIGSYVFIVSPSTHTHIFTLTLILSPQPRHHADAYSRLGDV